MFRDFIQNGQGRGEFGSALAEIQFDPGLLRPYFDQNGRKVCTVKTGRTVPIQNADKTFVKNEDGTTKFVPETEVVLINDLRESGIDSPVFNATTLSKDQWIRLDRRVIAEARKRLRAWGDLRAANTYGGFDGMTTSVLEHETITDDGEAIVDMEGLNEGRSDVSHYQLQGLPLPITHSSFWYSRRKLMTSRSQGTPISFVRAEQASRRVAETIEQTLIGTQAGMTYGDSSLYGRSPTVFGYTNFPDRIVFNSLPASAGVAAAPKAFVDGIIAMREASYAQNFFGPFIMYVSTDYDAVLDSDYKEAGASTTKTIRSRILEIDGISSIKRLDYLSGDNVLLVQMTSNVAEAVNGMELTTVQWESMGGMKLNFKVMAIQVPSLKADARGVTGIVHGTPA